MGKQNIVSQIRIKFFKLKKGIRIRYYKLLGLDIGKRVILGNINCLWPSKISIGNDCWIEDGVIFKITKPFDTKNIITIGNGVFIGANCQLNCNTQIVISDNCLVASNTVFVDTGHEFNADSLINKQPLTLGPIILEEDVWIGTQCSILKGVVIGKGSIIGAGSVVNKSIPPYQIWAGVPAKFIKNRV